MKLRSVGNVSDWRVFFRREEEGKALDVSHMFDQIGDETFDPTEAREVDCEGELIRLRDGDELIIHAKYLEA